MRLSSLFVWYLVQKSRNWNLLAYTPVDSVSLARLKKQMHKKHLPVIWAHWSQCGKAFGCIVNLNMVQTQFLLHAVWI